MAGLPGMMPPGLYLRGLAIGFAIAAAIGPIGLLCIRRTLAEGRAIGLATGLGAATADGLYAAVAAFGLTALSDVLIGQRRVLAIVGGALLLLLAARAWPRRRDETSAGTAVSLPAPRSARGAGQLAAAWATTLGLTITNPATIVSFAAAFVGFGLVGHGGPGAAALVLGVASGSAAWWVLLVGVVGVLRPRIGPVGLHRVGIASSAIIGFLGLAAIWGGLAG